MVVRFLLKDIFLSLKVTYGFIAKTVCIIDRLL